MKGWCEIKRNNKQIKGSHLKPSEICEHTNKCGIKNCSGKDSNRKFELSCGLRRGFLIADGFEVVYGIIEGVILIC